MNKLQFLEKRCRNQRRELSRLNKKFAKWYGARRNGSPDSARAQLTVFEHKFKPVEKERNKLRHENKQLKKRVEELEAALDETGCIVVAVDDYVLSQIGKKWAHWRRKGLIVEKYNTTVIGTPQQCPNLYRYLKEKQK